MINLNRRSVLKGSATSLAALSLPSFSSGAQAADALGPEALKSTLTPLGGLRAGNAEGTIPAWTGEFIPLPADYKPGTIRPDPFAADKPLFTITRDNLSKYEDKLSAGDRYLFKTYPDFRLPIYQTRRTVIAPQWVYDYTYKNASSATTTPDGNGISGAYGGTPFPIPKTGKQIVWNHILRWFGVAITDRTENWQVTSAGQKIMRATGDATVQFPYYMQGKEANWDGAIEYLFVYDTAPAYLEGQAVLARNPANQVVNPKKAWQYLVGERRTRLAPGLNYDTPVDSSGGIINWDEGEMFNGPLDQVDCKILGKKEMYVPYNTHKIWRAKTDDLLGARHLNPDYTRWELHRVWVVEMTLLPGKRNVDARRVLYVDEDGWNILAMDIYDSDDKLWKYHYNIPALCSDIPAMAGGFHFIAYDFHAASYVVFGRSETSPMYRSIPPRPSSYFTPGQLAATAGGS